MAHILTPFMIQMFFRKTYLTVFAFYFFESVEVFLVSTFSGDYVIFLGDDGVFEPFADTLLGDPFQGLLGLLVAHLIVQTFDIPYHSGKFIHGDLEEERVFSMRFFLFLLWIPCMSTANYYIPIGDEEDPYQIRLGVLGIVLWTPFVIWLTGLLGWKRFNSNTPPYWTQKSYRQYWITHIVWAITAEIIILSVLVDFWYPYFQTWIGCVLVLFICLIYLTYKKELYEFLWLINGQTQTIRKTRQSPSMDEERSSDLIE